ncbi:bifunctional transcriptional activator/DNA repair enzyme AdaA [Agaribacterium haliotis]|uniref:bifunctional transcriptional activator/DNA repair enzyme AdaA n=1 Tax=Agaribacterium haliotis TaxID=2013869 RepID=UPI000BB57048|nr:methylated-DNA--[protein]-cysteine S-methyltransferase [Agaribacterium haliotis]
MSSKKLRPDQRQLDYQRVEQAIHFIRNNYKAQPSLEQIADAVGLSAFHFQRMFTEWAGVSPKQFIQFLSLNYAKTLLQQRKSLMHTAYQSGLSGSARLHDMFVRIEGMTPGEFKSGGANLSINYSFAQSPFGLVLIASTAKGICYLHFEQDKQQAQERLRNYLPNAHYVAKRDSIQENALAIFHGDWRALDKIKLHLAATDFKLKVWQSLLTIPLASLASYSDVATAIARPGASRAVGSAVAANPVAFLIPCHRVIQQSGAIGAYRWGENKKSTIIAWEAALAAVSLKDNL